MKKHLTSPCVFSLSRTHIIMENIKKKSVDSSGKSYSRNKKNGDTGSFRITISCYAVRTPLPPSTDIRMLTGYEHTSQLAAKLPSEANALSAL